MPAVSICIPADQPLPALEQALDSVVVQRFLDYELVITDDSADDEIEALLDTYDFGGRLRYFRNLQPLGTPLNWEEAVRLARAPLVKLLLPQDRLAHPEALGRFVELIAAAPDAVFAFAATEGADSAFTASPTVLAALRRNPDSLIADNVVGPVSTMIYRRAPGLEFDPRLSVTADVDFYIRALRSHPRVIASDEALVALGPRLAAETGLQGLREAILMFEKGVDRMHGDPALALFFWREMKRHRIRNVKQLARIAALSPVMTGYFRELFAHPPREAGDGGFLGQALRPFRALFGA